MKNIAQELSDAQLDAISGGGCYRPEPKKCDYDYDYDYKKCEPKKRDYDCYKPRKKDCKSPWEKWYERAHDYFDKYES
jgi:hypothetical protein